MYAATLLHLIQQAQFAAKALEEFSRTPSGSAVQDLAVTS
jgi:hypothetical protein